MKKKRFSVESEAPKEQPGWDPAIIRAGKFSLYVLAVFLGATMAPRLLTFRSEWTHHQYSSPRYFGFVGNGVRFTDTIFVIFAGAIAGPSIVRLLLATSTAIRCRDWRLMRPSTWLLIDIAAWAAIVYLAYMANVLPMTKEMTIP